MWQIHNAVKVTFPLFLTDIAAVFDTWSNVVLSVLLIQDAYQRFSYWVRGILLMTCIIDWCWFRCARPMRRVVNPTRLLLVLQRDANLRSLGLPDCANIQNKHDQTNLTYCHLLSDHLSIMSWVLHRQVKEFLRIFKVSWIINDNLLASWPVKNGSKVRERWSCW